MKKCMFLLIAVNLFLLAQSQPESPWLVSGNSGTIAGIHFLGTTDNKPLRFRVNNVYAGEIDSMGSKAFFGFGAGKSITTGTFNVAVGFKALTNTTSGPYNVAIGGNALYSNTNGGYNVANGFNTLYFNTTGYSNTATGSYALHQNTTGFDNTAIGMSALYSNTSGSFNVAIGGNGSLAYNTTGTSNTATGYNAMYNNTTGSYNTAMGVVALASNTAGIHNVAIGPSALGGNKGSSASYNSAVGSGSLYHTSNSRYNTAIGYFSGYNYDMGYNNTMLGAYCDVNAAGLYNCVAVGELVTCTASSQARIGNSSTVSIGGYVGWSNISDGRYKKDISQNVKGLDFIMKLQPVTYHLDVSGLNKKLNADRDQETNKFNQQAITEKEQILYSGFVAQDVEKAAKETGYDFSGIDKPRNENDLYGLRYAEFVVPLVKAVQELSSQNVELKNQLDEIKKTSSDQRKLNEDLLERIKRLESSFVTKK
jgi:hypothetical protein